MERRLTAGAPKREDTTTERLMREFEQRIVASPPGVCPVDMQLSFLKVCHAQTCGKCVPCRVGLGQLENLLEDVLNNRATLETLHLIKETARNIQVTADCAIGFESARMVLVGLEGFKEDYLSHIQNKRCTASFEQPIPCITLCPAKVDIPGYVALVGIPVTTFTRPFSFRSSSLFKYLSLTISMIHLRKKCFATFFGISILRICYIMQCIYSEKSCITTKFVNN